MRLRQLTQASLLAALTAVSALVTVPLGPVPFTLQSLVVPLSGALLGPAGGFFSQVVYLLLGFAGLPVFAGFASGVGVLARPTGGFLLSFPLAAATAGWLTARLARGARPAFWRILGAMLVADAVVFAVGLPWLAYSLGPAAGKPFSLLRAAELGLLPFLLTDLFKLTAAAGLAVRLMPVLRPGNRVRERTAPVKAPAGNPAD
ncbi:MAG: biotin transporter BioY [Bacillota bacterium]